MFAFLISKHLTAEQHKPFVAPHRHLGPFSGEQSSREQLRATFVKAGLERKRGAGKRELSVRRYGISSAEYVKEVLVKVP